jgi:hypothetical protein
MDNHLPVTTSSPSREMRLDIDTDLNMAIGDWLTDDKSPNGKSPKRIPFGSEVSTWRQPIKEEPDEDVFARFNPIAELDPPSDGLTPQNPMDMSPITQEWTMDPAVLTQAKPIAVDSRKRKSVGGPIQGSLPISIKSTRSTARASTTPVLGNSFGSMGRSATGKQQLNLLYGASAHSEILATSMASSHELSASTGDEFDGNVKTGEKRRKRRESHNAVERRRRDTINDKITELYDMLPDVLIGMEGSGPGQAAGSRPNKGIILTRSVEFLKWLIRTNNVIEARLSATEIELRELRTQLGLDPHAGILGVPDDRPVLIAEPMPGQAPPRKRAGSVASTKSSKARAPSALTRAAVQTSRAGSDQYGTSPAASNLASALAASSLNPHAHAEVDVNAELLALRHLITSQNQSEGDDETGAMLQALLKQLNEAI